MVLLCEVCVNIACVLCYYCVSIVLLSC